MKKGLISKWLVFIVALGFYVGGNSQHKKVTPEVVATFMDVIENQSMSVTDFLMNSKDYSTFVNVLKTADSFSVLESEKDLIIFAPSNDAFALFPSEVMKQLFMPSNRHKLVSVADYHIVQSDLNLEEALEKSNHSLYLKARNGKLIQVELGSEEVLSIVDANGFTIDVGSKIQLRNGVVYPISEVLLPQVDVKVAAY